MTQDEAVIGLSLHFHLLVFPSSYGCTCNLHEPTKPSIRNQLALVEPRKISVRKSRPKIFPISDPNKSVQVVQPVAGIKTGDGDFIGSLSRMGHGLQRSYLLALLHELASSDAEEAPTLILACEEPELYQHPPQARHLADVFVRLAEGNNQVLVTTHSPLFVSGDGFEDVRLVRAAILCQYLPFIARPRALREFRRVKAKPRNYPEFPDSCGQSALNGVEGDRKSG